MYGIEKDPIAHALASIVVWIGYIQWQKNNGYISQREPILEDLHGNIRCMDAIMTVNHPHPLSSQTSPPPGPTSQTSPPPNPLPASGEGESRRVPVSGEGESGRTSATGDTASTPLSIYGEGLGEGIDTPAGEGINMPRSNIDTYTTRELWDKLKPLAREMRKEPTPAENALWQRLRGKQVLGYKFRRQHPIDRFIVDFYCTEARLVVEVDGPVHDYTQEEDAIRTEFIESLGLRVIRFNNDDVLQQIDTVLERIGEELQRLPSTSQTFVVSPIEPIISEPDWPEVDVIVGNPPFLGGNKIRAELGDYVDKLFKLYDGRVPAFADLVCYWFEKARAHLAAGKAKRAGLLATNSIRGGVNREVLKRIKDSGDIFMAWSDRDWVLEGAAVRVSMVGFGGKYPHPPTPSATGIPAGHPLRSEGESGAPDPFPSPRSGEGLGVGMFDYKMLDGCPVASINADLTASVDITQAKQLEQNLKICFIGAKKAGDFDIDAELAKKFLGSSNSSGRNNSDVVFPWLNGERIVKRMPERWIISFGDMLEDESRLYEKPFQYVLESIYAERQKNNEERARIKWWQHRRPATEMREAVAKLNRFIATPRVSKHRIFAWYPSNTLPDDGIYIFARDDDYFFGVLHSHIHEIWSLRMGTSLEDRPRYTPTTTFETFPFPWSPGKEDTESDAYKAIAAAAKQLHEERAAWLTPPHPKSLSHRDSRWSPTSGEGLKTPPLHSMGRGVGGGDRTLTNLYNALNGWRGKETIKVKPDAADFAPRLDELHTALDKAVCAAYGWPESTLADDEEVLRRLLELNLSRAGQSA